MKHLVFIVVIAAGLFACNTDTRTTNETDTSTHAAYAPSDGDVTYRSGKVMVWRDGEWKEADSDVHLNNGVVVNRKGEVIKEDKVVVLDDGEVVNRSGRFFDKAGNAIDDAWDATKKGVKKAGEEVKDVFTDDDKNDNK
ncbi:MAG TPA: DUF6799 domain-containing protein [Flavisolibacter sp.]|nr:DUF6799 domain-containing protein [Flavisolibacter sp.]